MNRITLDMNKRLNNFNPTVFARQGDLNSEPFEISLQRDGENINWIEYVKPANKTYFEMIGRRTQVRVEATALKPSTTNLNLATFTIPGEALTEAGTMEECYFRFEGPNKQFIASTARFIMTVRPSAIATLSASYVDEIEKLIKQINDALASANLDNLDQRLKELSDKVAEAETGINAQLVKLQNDSDVSVKALYKTMDDTTKDITNTVNALTLRLDNELTASDKKLTDYMNNIEQQIQTQIDALQAQIDALDIKTVILETFKSPEVDALLRAIAKEEVTKQFDAAGAASIPTVQKMLGSTDGTTPAPELQATLGNFALGTPASVPSIDGNFINKTAGNVTTNPNIIKLGNMATLLAPTDSGWVETVNTVYRQVEKEDGTVAVATAPLNQSRNFLAGFDIVGLLGKQYPNLFDGLTTTPQKAELARAVLSRIITNVKAVGTYSGGNFVKLNMFGAGAWQGGDSISNTTANLKNINFITGNPKFYITSDGFFYVAVSSYNGDGSTATTISVDAITISIELNARLTSLFATRAELSNYASLTGGNVFTGATRFSAGVDFTATNGNDRYMNFYNNSGKRMGILGYTNSTATDFTIASDTAGQPNGGINLVPTGTGRAKVNGNRIVDDSIFPVSKLSNGADLDSLVTTGTYVGSNLTNLPTFTGSQPSWFWYIEVVGHVTSDYALQRAKTFYTSSPEGVDSVFMRTKTAGKWGSWIEYKDSRYSMPTNVDGTLKNPTRGISFTVHENLRTGGTNGFVAEARGSIYFRAGIPSTGYQGKANLTLDGSTGKATYNDKELATVDQVGSNAKYLGKATTQVALITPSVECFELAPGVVHVSGSFSAGGDVTSNKVILMVPNTGNVGNRTSRFTAIGPNGTVVFSASGISNILNTTTLPAGTYWIEQTLIDNRLVN